MTHHDSTRVHCCRICLVIIHQWIQFSQCLISLIMTAHVCYAWSTLLLYLTCHNPAVNTFAPMSCGESMAASVFYALSTMLPSLAHHDGTLFLCFQYTAVLCATSWASSEYSLANVFVGLSWQLMFAMLWVQYCYSWLVIIQQWIQLRQRPSSKAWQQACSMRWVQCCLIWIIMTAHVCYVLSTLISHVSRHNPANEAT